MTREPIMIGGQKIGRFRASVLLFKESFRFLRADKEMLWFPVVAFVLQCFLLGLATFFFVAGYLVLGGGEELAARQEQTFGYFVLLVLYIIGAFSVATSQAGIAHLVFTRAHGGDATFGQALAVVRARSGQLFVWSFVTSTVGLVLNMIANHSRLVGKVVAALLGAAWSILTYFVVQGIVIDKKEAFTAIRHSATVFRRTWGETLVTNISLGLVFLLAHLMALVVFIGLVILSFITEPTLLVVAIPLYLVWLFGSVLLSSSLDAVLRTLLYVYASENTAPTNFNRELLEQMLSRRGAVTVAPVATPPTV